MRTTYAHRYFNCDCGNRFGRVIEISPKETEKLPCDCGKEAHQEERAEARDHNLFRPFWSDTLQKPIKDRMDLAELRSYAKANGLTNVGHRDQKPDRAAIRWNYEH